MWILLAAGCGCSERDIVGDADDEDPALDVADSGHDLVEDTAGEPDLDCSATGCPEGMVLVPCGPFVMGTDEDEGGIGTFWESERPEHVVWVSSFCMDEHEVTNGEWKECMAAGACTPPSDIYCRLPEDNYFTDPDKDDHPVIKVDWFQAVEYCEWRGGRLPTEAEWEKAARGGCEVVPPDGCGEEDERTYPWGEEIPDCVTYARYDNDDSCGECPTSVGSFPEGASPYGIMDMAGNVSEWISDWFAQDYYSTGGPPWVDPSGPLDSESRVTRDIGSHTYIESELRVTLRRGVDPEWSMWDVGLRCAASPF
jgi:formylglycine-generating enzyme required for sulfatase activity